MNNGQSPRDLPRRLQIAAELARQAGHEIMEIYHTDFSVSYKGPADPVTKADQRANDLIVTALHHQFPEDLVVAEESPQPTGTVFPDFIWYVDPLDGTKEFIAKNGEFSVMIGLTFKGSPCLGVVYKPDEDILYAGFTDQEAWIEHGGSRRLLHPTTHAVPDHLTLVVSRSHRPPFTEAIKKRIGLVHERSCGSVGLKIGLIATGQADIYIEPRPYTKAWDACAPEAILRGAGGRFTDAHGRPLRYDPRQLTNPAGLVGTNGACHETVIRAIAPIMAELIG